MNGLTENDFVPADLMPPRIKLTVYTALVGPKEEINNPLSSLPPAVSDLDLDFVCITDNKNLRSQVWRFVYLPTSHLPPEKLSRRPKALPHEYFPDAEFSLYIDNTVTFRRLPQASDLSTHKSYLFRAFRHATRDTLQQEADAVAMLGYDDIATICNQLDFVASRTTLDSISPLTTATLLLRSHHSDVVRRFGVLWWECLLAFSKRDQLSIDFALQQSGASIEYLPGGTQDNDFIIWNGSLGPNRIRASFDAKRYAWLHRDDPQAQLDPKAHFLTHVQDNGERYQRRMPLLDYICFQQRSSLGSQISPRRDMAEALESLLLRHKPPNRVGGCRYLIVRVHAKDSPRCFDADELAAAGCAIGIFMGRDGIGTALDLPSDDLNAVDKVYTAPLQPFDLLIVLGLAGHQLVVAAEKLVRLITPRRGALVAVLTSPASLQDALRTEALMADHVGIHVRTAVQSSRHDDELASLENTVLGFTCGALAVTSALLSQPESIEN